MNVPDVMLASLELWYNTAMFERERANKLEAQLKELQGGQATGDGSDPGESGD